MLRDFSKALNSITKSKELSNSTKLNVIHGECEFLVRQALHVIRTTWRLKGADITHEVHDAKDLREEDIAQMVSHNSLFEDYCVHIIKRCDGNTKIFKLFEKYLKKHKNLKNFIYISSNKKKLPNFISKYPDCTIINCELLNLVDTITLAKHFSNKRALKLSPDSYTQVINIVGDDLSQLENEIEKLALIFTDRNEQISLDEITPHLGLLKEEHAFKLDDYLIKRQYSHAQLLIEELLSRGEEALRIIGLIARHCRISIKAKTMKRGQEAKLGMPFFIVKKYIPYVKNMNINKFVNVLNLCSEADIKLKSKRISALILLLEIIEGLS